MQVKTRTLTFANGDFLVDLENPSFVVRAPKDLADGDWKTAMIHGWTYLHKDEQMEVDKIFVNAYGLFVSGVNPRRKRVDLNPRDVIYVKGTEA